METIPPYTTFTDDLAGLQKVFSIVCSAEELSDGSLEALAFTIQSIVYSICNNSIHINDEILFGLVEVGSKLLEIRDLVSVLNIGFEVLAYTLPKVKLTIERPFLYSTLKRIMDLLTLHTSLSVKKSAMATLKSIIESNEAQTEALLDANLLLVLGQILASNQESLKQLCCRILRTPLSKPYVLQFIESNSLCTVMDIIRNVYNTLLCHWEAISIIKEIIGLGESYAYSLIKAGAVKVIIANLYKFAEQDEILRKVYNFEGCYYNVPYLLDCLNTLDVILSGRATPKSEGVLGVLIDQLDKEAVSILIVETFIKEQLEFDPQYMKIETETEPRQLLINIIGHIIAIHENSGLESSKAILLQVKSFFFTFLSQGSTEVVKIPMLGCEIPDEFVIVVYFFTPEEFSKGKHWIVRLGSSSTLKELYQAIANEYRSNESMTLKIMQKNGKNYTIDAEATFKKAIKETLVSLNRAPDEVEELPMWILVEFVHTQSLQSLNLNMNKTSGNIIKSQGCNPLTQGFSYTKY